MKLKSKNILMAVILTSIVGALTDDANAQPVQPLSSVESSPARASSPAQSPDTLKVPAGYRMIILTPAQEVEVNQMVTHLEREKTWAQIQAQMESDQQEMCEYEKQLDKSPWFIKRHRVKLLLGSILLLVALVPCWLFNCGTRHHKMPEYAPKQLA